MKNIIVGKENYLALLLHLTIKTSFRVGIKDGPFERINFCGDVNALDDRLRISRRTVWEGRNNL